MATVERESVSTVDKSHTQGPHLVQYGAEIVDTISCIEKMRHGNNYSFLRSYEMAEETRHKGQQNEAVYYSFWLNSTNLEKSNEAFRQLTIMANEGCSIAQGYLGHCLVTQSNPKGIEMLELAAKAGVKYATHYLALHLSTGNLIPVDLNKANQMWHTLANEEYPPSMHEFGYSCYKGRGLNVDRPLGKKWLTKACNAGFSESYHLLRKIYKKESGVSSLGLASVDTEPSAW
jgi:TPR repeat protein